MEILVYTMTSNDYETAARRELADAKDSFTRGE
jgi:hypothetical protein